MISVVIPTIGSHTLEQFEEAISSALAVSPELISQVCIMDNSKNEEFQNKMKSYLERDKRVEYQHKKEQLNLAQNLNRGFEVANNDWLLFLCDDDGLFPEAFKGLNQYLDEKQEQNRLERYEGNEHWYHASGAGSCSRKLYYESVERLEPTIQLDEKTKRLLRLGTVIHDDIQNSLTRAHSNRDNNIDPDDNKVFTYTVIDIDFDATYDELDENGEPTGNKIPVYNKEALKKTIILQIKQQAYILLNVTDWYAARKSELGTDIPQTILDERKVIRDKAEALETEVNALDNVEAILKYTYSFTEQAEQPE